VSESEPQQTEDHLVAARRSTHIDHEVVYAEVGASASADLLRFPPKGSSPFEHSLKLGSGSERFATASSTLMTWGAQTGSGIAVEIEKEAGVSGYAGVVFDDQGVPVAAPPVEIQYSPEGEPYLTAGTVATLRWPKGKAVRTVRVMYVTDEPLRTGFAIGTVDDAGVVGELSFLVEHREDDTVWAVARGFYRPPNLGLFGFRARAALRLAEKDAQQQLAALAPGAAVSGRQRSRSSGVSEDA